MATGAVTEVSSAAGGSNLSDVAFAFWADFAVWAIYATFVPTAIVIALFFVQYVVVRSLARRNARSRMGAQTA